MSKNYQHKNELSLTDRYKNAVPFFNIIKNREGQDEISISNSRLILFWESLGYRKVVLENGNYFLVIVKRNSIVRVIKEHQLRSEIRDYTKFINRDDVWAAYLDKEYVVKKLFESFQTIEISRNAGDDKTGYLFYQNVILKVTQDNVEEVKYEGFNGFVWELEVIKRDFRNLRVSDCVFGQFLQIIADNDEQRTQSIASIIGYLIHSFKDPSYAKAIILMDTEIDVESEEANGGTGKSLIAKAVGYIVCVLFVDGKTTKIQDRFCLSALNLHHRIILYDDVKKDFDFESLYPIITGDLHIEKKYKNAVVIPNKETPKIIITSNYVVKGGGGNAEKRRKIEYEVSSYFKNKLSPLEEFGHRLFEDWDDEEWIRFDNFMVKLLQYYLKNGIIEPLSINIDSNRLKLETSVDFIDFMDSLLSNTILNIIETSPEILVIDKAELFNSFMNTKPNTTERLTINTLKKWIDRYCDFNKIKRNHYKSNGKVLVGLVMSDIIAKFENQNTKGENT